jgi:hypothetical protein
MHDSSCVDRPEGLAWRDVANIGHGDRQQAEQHTGRRQQNGQEVRELNSEEDHVSFPSPAGPFARRHARSVQTVDRDPRELRLNACPSVDIRSNHRPGSMPREMTLSIDHTQY